MTLYNFPPHIKILLSKDEILDLHHTSQIMAQFHEYSPYLTKLCERHMDFVHELVSQDGDILYQTICDNMSALSQECVNQAPVMPETTLMASLRQYKAQIALLTAYYDISKQWPF